MVTMRGNSALALSLDFDGPTVGAPGGPQLRLAPKALRRPDKYKVLEHQRRQAQIRARRLLELAEEKSL
jgi:hypothetical protein